MKDKKKIVIGVLCALVAVMAVGYAALAQQLNITGTASIDSTWKVEITNISERDIIGDATSKEVPSYTATTANFSVGLIQPGDSITYDIEVSNLGTLAAKVDSIDVIMDENDAIIYTTEGIKAGDKLGVDETNTLSVTVAYDPDVTSQPENTAKDITVTINYVQDIGATDVVDPTPDVQEPTGSYNTYSVGDQINFAGSDWRVIKNSSAEEDYVTLMKETILTNAELGEYAANDADDTMAYYWSDTCHDADTYGYTDSDDSGCADHNNYEGSKVKEYLEGSYINTLGADNLQEVDGYKARLLTQEELDTNLSIYADGDIPSWLQSFDSNDMVYSYMTMTPDPDDSSSILYVDDILAVYGESVKSGGGVRPVINLLKTSI